jgi:hypothetical protein
MMLIFMLDKVSGAAICEINCFDPQFSNLTCDEFSSWSEVNTELISNNCTINPPNPVTLMLSEPILFTSELNVSFVDSFYDLWLYGVSGVSVYPWPALSVGSSKKSMIFNFSTIEFYVNNTPPSGYTCTPRLLPDNSAKSVSFLSSYTDTIFFGYGNKYSSSSQSVCPFLFRNASIATFQIDYQVDTFLFVNLLKFQQVNDTKTSSINSNISELDISKSYNYKLDTDLLNPLVFEYLRVLNCLGSIKSIRTGLFEHFKRLTIASTLI